MENKKIRDCSTCEMRAVGCEETCEFRIEEESKPRGTLLKKRKAMKAEKANAVKKAERLVSSANKNKGQKNLHATPKKSYQKADKNLEKQRKRREKRREKNVSG